MKTEKTYASCAYCGKSMKGYSWADIATHFKEKHNISMLDSDEDVKRKLENQKNGNRR